MRWVTLIQVRIRSLVRRRQVELELDEELRYHVERQMEEHMASGMSPQEARVEALREWYGVETRKEECRDMRGWNFFDHLTRDLKYSMRQLRKTPSFTATALLALSLGIGAAIAVFAYVDAALLKPMPYTNPNQLVDVAEITVNIPRSNLSYQDYLDWRKADNGLQSLASYTGSTFLYNTPDGAERVSGGRITANFLRTLGVQPFLGRDFVDGEDTPEATQVVMVSYGSWMTRFGGDRNLIGKTITLGDSPYVVVGILPREFHFSFLGKPEIWVPINGSRPCEKRRSCHNLFAVGRMKDGVQFETVQAKLATLARQLEQQFPDSNRGQGANVRPLVQVAAERVRPILLVMLAGALLLLLISYLNVAALLLVRAENRRREVAIRGALGASSGRLLCQFVTEGVTLITGGAVIGLLIANWAIKGMLALIPQRMLIARPYRDNLGLNWHSYVGTVALSLLAAVLFSAIPSLYVTGASLGTGLAEGSRGSAGLAWRRLGSRLVILEFAAAMVLLTGAGLIGKSLYQLLHVDIGLRSDHVATIAFRAPSASYDTPEKQIALEREVLTMLGRMPELESVAAGSQMPVSFNGNTNWIRIEGQPYNGEHNEVNNRQVSPAYFSTIGAKLARGRYFNVSDDSTHPNVVIVNQALVRKHFPNGEDPIGKRIGDTQLSARSIQTIVGVVEDVRDGALDSEIWPAVYECSLQSPDSEFTIFARTRVPPELVLQPMRAVLRQQYPTAAINNEISMEDQIQQSPTSYMHRSSAYLVGVFAAVALILGIVGLYGVVAYSVGQRTREIGIRMALGAVPQAVRRLILRESAALIGIAVLLGAAGSIGGATILRGFFFRVAAWDFTALLGVTVVLVAAALIAAYLPARRAASVNPVDVLRSE